MTFVASDEQRSIIEAELAPQCVIACPGSGKTATAVRRLLEIRRRLGFSRCYAALLSHSNVAVDTFQTEFERLTLEAPGLSPRVSIDTVDGFITHYVLRPHAARTMGAPRTPFLVYGTEPFLASCRIFNGNFPQPIADLRMAYRDAGSLDCGLWQSGKLIQIDQQVALRAIRRLGGMGAYTHELGRYWAIETLLRDERLLAALCRRFPHVLVDEAQDIGPLQGTFLELLTHGGAQVSLIGDPNQGIYDFAGADGQFLRDYAQGGAAIFQLTQNRRSIPAIVDVANLLVGTTSRATREAGHRQHGAHYLVYDEANVDALVSAFITMLREHGYQTSEAVVVCRANATVDKLTGRTSRLGQAATEQFAHAAILRDRAGDMRMAFDACIRAVLRLLDPAPQTLRLELMQPSAKGDAHTLRRLLWKFLRNPEDGLPDAGLRGRSGWQPALKERVASLLRQVEATTAYRGSNTWRNSLTTAALDDTPLWEPDLVDVDRRGLRMDTVHKVKGEGIPVVLYVARTQDITQLLAGGTTELGRIGYVAVTRARDWLLVAVPRTARRTLLDKMEAAGIQRWNG